MIDKDLLEQLERAAQAATPGPYYGMAGMPSNVLNAGGLRVARCDFDGTFNLQTAANGRFFSASDPRTVLALISRVRELESNESAYTAIIGERSYQEVADTLEHARNIALPETPDAWRIFDGEGRYDYQDDEPTPAQIAHALRYSRVYEPLVLQQK